MSEVNKFIAERARLLGSLGRMIHLCVSTCEAIKALALKGWSGRRIARELAVNRETVARYLGPSKPAIPTPGSHSGRRSLCEVHLAENNLAIVSGSIKSTQSTVRRIVSIWHPTEGSGIFQKVVDRPVNIGHFNRVLWISLADSDPRLQCVFLRNSWAQWAKTHPNRLCTERTKPISDRKASA